MHCLQQNGDFKQKGHDATLGTSKAPVVRSVRTTASRALGSCASKRVFFHPPTKMGSSSAIGGETLSDRDLVLHIGQGSVLTGAQSILKRLISQLLRGVVARRRVRSRFGFLLRTGALIEAVQKDAISARFASKWTPGSDLDASTGFEPAERPITGLPAFGNERKRSIGNIISKAGMSNQRTFKSSLCFRKCPSGIMISEYFRRWTVNLQRVDD
jgi:hypothetical protein